MTQGPHDPCPLCEEYVLRGLTWEMHVKAHLVDLTDDALRSVVQNAQNLLALVQAEQAVRRRIA